MEDYVVHGQLGIGPLGTVLLAVHAPSGETVRIKRISCAGVSSTPDVLNAVSDAAALVDVDHPSLSRVRSVVADGTDLNIVGDYVPAVPLHQLLPRLPPLTERDIAQLLLPIVRGLAYFHASLAAHGALTPANILITATGLPLLTDHFISRAIHSAFVSQAQAGPSPPKARRANPAASEDIFALGALALYLAERAPFVSPQSNCPTPTLVNRSAWSVSFHDLLARCFAPGPARARAQDLLSHPFLSRAVATAGDAIPVFAGVASPLIAARTIKGPDATCLFPDVLQLCRRYKTETLSLPSLDPTQFDFNFGEHPTVSACLLSAVARTAEAIADGALPPVAVGCAMLETARAAQVVARGVALGETAHP
jgi:serine/threonine protein kinase